MVTAITFFSLFSNRECSNTTSSSVHCFPRGRDSRSSFSEYISNKNEFQCKTVYSLPTFQLLAKMKDFFDFETYGRRGGVGCGDSVKALLNWGGGAKTEEFPSSGD